MENYEFLEHTADIKFKARGRNLGELFKNSAKALIKTINSEEKIKDIKERIIKVNGRDKEELLLNFLEEFLYLVDAKNFLTSKITNLKINGNQLVCKVIGDDFKNYNLSNHVKAITYSGMKIKKENGFFEVKVVLDV